MGKIRWMQESLFRDLASTFYYYLLISYLRDNSCHSSDLSYLASWLNLAKERSYVQ